MKQVQFLLPTESGSTGEKDVTLRLVLASTAILCKLIEDASRKPVAQSFIICTVHCRYHRECN